MARQNVRTAKAAVQSPVRTKAKSTGPTFEGGPGFDRKLQGELFLLATTNMSGEDTFYEQAMARDSRYVELIHRAARKHPLWTAELLRWLRGEANMRTASIIGAAEYAKARQGILDEPEAPTIRTVVDSVLLRADEPGEMLAYWITKYGRTVITAMKRGIGDAMIRLGSEFNYLKWDGEGRGIRFADVLNLTHPGDRKGSAQHIAADWQHELFAHIVKTPYAKDLPIPEGLATLTRRQALMALPVDERRAALEPVRLRQAGMTWEALGSWLQGPMDATAWAAIIPSMGYGALLRNLRNFDEAGIDDEVAGQVIARLTDPEQVRRSRLFPMRFLSAHRAVPSLRWGHPLEQAMTLSLSNIPRLPKRTLVLIDTSTSMNAGFSKDGTLMRWDAAAIFGLALASRCEVADVVSFSSNRRNWDDPAGAKTKVFALRKAESVLGAVGRWKAEGYFLGGGTDTEGALRKHFDGHDRVVLLTDEQNGSPYAVGSGLPAGVKSFTANLAGYARGHAPSGIGDHHTVGGLTDQMFKLIPMLEAGRDGTWPWETKTA